MFSKDGNCTAESGLQMIVGKSLKAHILAYTLFVQETKNLVRISLFGYGSVEDYRHRCVDLLGCNTRLWPHRKHLDGRGRKDNTINAHNNKLPTGELSCNRRHYALIFPVDVCIWRLWFSSKRDAGRLYLQVLHG